MIRLPAGTSARAKSAEAPWGRARKKSGMSPAASAAGSEGEEHDPAVYPAHPWNHLGQRLPRVRARRHHRELDPRVPEEEPHEDLARVTRCADNADFHDRERIYNAKIRRQMEL